MEQSQWLMTAQLLYQIKEDRKRLEQQEKELFEQLKALSENKTKHEGEYVFVKEIRAGNIDYSAIDLLQKVNLDLFRKPSTEVWKLIKVVS